MSFLVTIAIIGVVVLAAIIGSSRGLIVAGSSLLALLLGLTIAGVGYEPLAGPLSDITRLAPGVGRILAYLLLLGLVQISFLLLLRFITARKRGGELNSRVDQAGGAAIAISQAVIIAAIGLSVIVQLPFSIERKNQITSAFLAGPLISLGNRLQSIVSTPGEKDVTETLTLLTVDPSSQVTVQLGYTTTNVSVNEPAEQQVLELLNQERRVRGLPELTMRDDARKVARAHSRDMFARGYFSHQTPEGISPFQRLQQGGVVFLVAGENLALAPSVQQAHDGLMNSPPHRENILSPNYRQVGVGIIDGGRYGLMVTQNFTN